MSFLSRNFYRSPSYHSELILLTGPSNIQSQILYKIEISEAIFFISPVFLRENLFHPVVWDPVILNGFGAEAGEVYLLQVVY